MARNPSGDADANRRQLVAADPDAGESVDAPGVDAIVARGTNQHVFEVADVAVNVAAIRPEIHDGVPDDLAGSVVGDIAAASGLVHLDAAGRQRCSRREDVTAAAIATHAKRQHVGMLDEQQQIADPVRAPLFDERPLQRERLGIAHPAETPDFNAATHLRSLERVLRFGGHVHLGGHTHLARATHLSYLTHSTHLTC